VSSGTVKTTTTLEFTPQLRPMLGVGLISGTPRPAHLNPSALATAQSADVFAREIESVSRSFDGGKDAAAARTALFLKGKVLGSTLLTLAYDSDKPSDTRCSRHPARSVLSGCMATRQREGSTPSPPASCT